MSSEPDFLAKYGRSAPRYTSYPTAPHFSDEINDVAYKNWLGAVSARDRASIYVHVPYCRQLCWYCGCAMRATTSYKPITQYVDTLCREIELVANATPQSPKVARLHWGGGSPTILSGADFLFVTHEIRSAFPFADTAEVAIEIDPRTIDDVKIEILAAAGVTRASLGVQTFAAHIQDAINRRQSPRCVARAVAQLRAAGIRNISFDLMYGLPFQTCDDIKSTISECMDFRPDRISVFGYAHVPWMKKHQNLILEETLPNDAQRMEQSAMAADLLVEAGYVQIGMDHFALPNDSLAQCAGKGALHRNFQGYTDDSSDCLIGLGASAIGSFRDGYVQNTPDVPAYLSLVGQGRLATARGIQISNDDRLRREIIERLMCDFSTDLGEICARHGVPVDALREETGELREMEKDGLVEFVGERITVPPNSRSYIRTVCAVFDAYLKSGKAQHSSVI